MKMSVSSDKDSRRVKEKLDKMLVIHAMMYASETLA